MTATPRPHVVEPPLARYPAVDPPLVAADLADPTARVADVMTAGPRTCSRHSSLVEVSLLFRDCDCGVVPVTEDGKPVGVVTDRDLALEVSHRDGLLANVAAEQVMSTDLATIGPDTPLEEAVGRLGTEGVRRLLVVDDAGLLVGVLSFTDLVAHVNACGIGRVVAEIARRR